MVLFKENKQNYDQHTEIEPNIMTRKVINTVLEKHKELKNVEKDTILEKRLVETVHPETISC